MGRLLIILALLVSLRAEDIYVAQTAAGSDNGTSAGNAHSLAWLNTGANWGGGAGEVDPGDTVHLCGTFTGTAIFQTSGTTGNLITFVFESGAKFSAVHWNQAGANGNAAIFADTKSYIKVDGGVNGFIEATANGTALANQLDCHGVRFNGDQIGNMVCNLVVSNLYQRTASSTTDANNICNGIYLFSGAIQSCVVSNVTTVNAGSGVALFLSNGSSTNTVTRCAISKHAVGLNVGSTGVNVTNDTLIVSYNAFSNDLTWSGNAAIHQDNAHIFFTQSGSLGKNVFVYGNSFTGNLGTNPTGLLYLEGYGSGALVYNNLFFHDTFSGGTGDLTVKGFHGARVHNNTFVNNTPGGNTAIGLTEWTGFDQASFTNNIIVDYNYVFFDSTTEGGGTAVSAADYNIIYPNTQLFRYGGVSGHTYADWIATGKNAHGVTSNPNLDGNYKLVTGSSAIGAGAPLAEFSTDRDGDARGSLWDIGQDQFVGSSPSEPSAVYAGRMVQRR